MLSATMLSATILLGILRANNKNILYKKEEERHTRRWNIQQFLFMRFPDNQSRYLYF